MTRVIVGLGTCGVAAGAEETFRALRQELAGRGEEVQLGRTGCIGMCYQEPLVEVRGEDGSRYLYGKLDSKKVGRLASEHLAEGKPIDEWLVWTERGTGAGADYLDRQTRIVLRNCGRIDPESMIAVIRASGSFASTTVRSAS